MFRWSVVVIARNEAARLGACLDLAAGEMRGRFACLTIIINGSTDASADIARAFVSRTSVPTRLFAIPFGDKSNAWNYYVHSLAPAASSHIFVDGYAYVAPGSFSALDAALEASPNANAASGMPMRPRVARESMVRTGGLQGSLHALRERFLVRLRDRGLHLPIGLYWGDGLIGSFARHDCDANATNWDKGRVALAPDATWTLPPRTLRSLLRRGRRRISQARGALQNEAVKSIIYPLGFHALPRFANDMLREYLKAHPEKRPGWTDIPGRLAVRHLGDACTPSEADLTPRLVVSTMERTILAAAAETQPPP